MFYINSTMARKGLYKRFSYICLCKTQTLSVKLNMCICVSMPELKRKNRLVLTYMCMWAYMCVSLYVSVFRSTLLTVVCISRSSGVNLPYCTVLYRSVLYCWSVNLPFCTVLYRSVLYCWSVILSTLNQKNFAIYIFGKIKVDQSKIF